ncbi:hypothetical protein [Legionella sainthelensi]|uniref:Uncharacterized protein n=1 Tax=Legionella sainthelensi TaxID=28087 RepID=A0A2H5FLR0_9GAMM|nr:hypothetical protein [Legionella sainthelensi]AUH72481.1 hypothetical protein CAB17_10725 [Legionella sainthelensi]
MKINLNAYITEKTNMNQFTIYNIRNPILIKSLVFFIVGLVWSQNVLAEPGSSFAYCGKTVVCQGDHTCTMLEGNYQLFKPFVVGDPFYAGTFTLNKVIVWNYAYGKKLSQNAACYYSTPPNSNMVVQFWSLPNTRFGIAQYYPASEGWIYDDPDSVHSSGKNIWACNGSKFECRMEHLN